MDHLTKKYSFSIFVFIPFQSGVWFFSTAAFLLLLHLRVDLTILINQNHRIKEIFYFGYDESNQG